MAYQLHPDPGLQAAFKVRPYQGAAPDKAEFLFLGLDANFAKDIAKRPPLYREVLEYLADGVAYWQRHGVHHPFLRYASAKDGLPYHRSFTQIGFTPEDADRISFVELLHVPTVGRSRPARGDLEDAHLESVKQWMTGGSVRCVFLSRGVARRLRGVGLFEEMKRPASELVGGLSGWTLVSGQRLLLHYHFSVWGCQYERLQKDLAKIREIVRPQTG